MLVTENEDNIIIREYIPADISGIVGLFYSTVHTVNARDYTAEQLDAWAGRDVDCAEWDRTFRQHHSVVAVADRTITGFGDMDDTGYLDRLYVHRDYQGRGIGGRICRELEAYAKSLGIHTVTSHVSITARPFFERRGYVAVRGQLVERKGVTLKNYVMEKKIRES